MSAFILAGDVYVDRARLEAPIRVRPGSDGYDGQFYYRLGLDPFTSEQTAHGIRLDNPPARGARILFPLLAWVAALGRPGLVAWAMFGLNLLGLFALAGLGIGIARRWGGADWLGLLPSLYPGFMVTLVRDTTEIVASVPTLAAVMLALRGRAWAAGLCGAVAVFARETTLLALAGFGLAELARCVRARRFSAALAAYALPAVAFLVWQLIVLYRWRLASFSRIADQDLGPPLQGLCGFFVANLQQVFDVPVGALPWRAAAFALLSALMCLAAPALAGAVALRRRAPAELMLSWASYAGLILCFTTSIWIEPHGFLRGCTEIFVLSAVVIIVARERIAGLILLVLMAPVWVISATLP